MKTILQEIDSINSAYKAIGRTSPTTEQEEESIKATQVRGRSLLSDISTLYMVL